MSGEKMLKAKTVYYVLGSVIIVFCVLLYMQLSFEVNPDSDTIVMRWRKTPKPAPAVVAVAPTKVVFVKEDAKLGSYLTDANGMTLYNYAEDKDGTIHCTGTCINNWPAFVVADANVAADGPASGKLATITIADGKMQLTYNGMPLYHYIQDKVAGDTKGNGITKGAWKIVKP